MDSLASNKWPTMKDIDKLTSIPFIEIVRMDNYLFANY